MRFLDVLNKAYWHARSPEFLDQDLIRLLELLRMPGDLVFICVGVIPLVMAAQMVYGKMRTSLAR